MSNISDPRITTSNALLRGLDTMLHKEGEASSAGPSEFSQILSGIVETANETDATAHNSVAAMMTGDYDPDVVMLNSTKAELALTLMVQVRDRALEAYNEIMRMQL